MLSNESIRDQLASTLNMNSEVHFLWLIACLGSHFLINSSITFTYLRCWLIMYSTCGIMRAWGENVIKKIISSSTQVIYWILNIRCVNVWSTAWVMNIKYGWRNTFFYDRQLASHQFHLLCLNQKLYVHLFKMLVKKVHCTRLAGKQRLISRVLTLLDLFKLSWCSSRYYLTFVLIRCACFILQVHTGLCMW